MFRHSLCCSSVMLALCGVMLLPPVSLAAASPGVARTEEGRSGTASRQTKTGDVNGWVWQDSDNAAKLSFLLGVENGIAMEYALARIQAQEQGRNLALSPFQQGWMDAFDNVPRQRIVGNIDAYYAAHPDERDRHVFDVIWTEMITPVSRKK